MTCELYLNSCMKKWIHSKPILHTEINKCSFHRKLDSLGLVRPLFNSCKAVWFRFRTLHFSATKCSPAFSWSSSAAPPAAVSPLSDSWSLPAWWRRELMGRRHGAVGQTAQTASGEYWGRSEELARHALIVKVFKAMSQLSSITPKFNLCVFNI